MGSRSIRRYDERQQRRWRKQRRRQHWRDETQMPFLNPKTFCKEESLARITEQSDVVCAVSTDSVDVKLDGRVIARLEAGARPGWSILASRKGPLAQPLV